MKTVKDLKKLLNDLPPEADDMIVVQSSDEEGNSIEPFYELGEGVYYDGELQGDDFVEEGEDLPAGAVKVIVLWP